MNTSLPDRHQKMAIPIIASTLLCWGAFSHSPSLDEVGHFGAGISHWTLGKFHLYAVNPPLVRMIATVPAVLLGAESDYSEMVSAPEKRFEFEAGKRSIQLDSATAQTGIALGRFVLIPLVLLGLWGLRRLLPSSLESHFSIAGVLWLASPLMLAHGSMITPDASCASAFVVAVFALRKWLDDFRWSNAVVFGLASGAAMLIKFTSVPIVSFATLLALGFRITKYDRPFVAHLKGVAQLICVVSIAFYTINAGYGFSESFRPLGSIPFVSETLAPNQEAIGQAESIGAMRNRFSRSAIAWVPVPLPQCFVQGIDIQKHDFERGNRSYLMGEWKHGGWWYYYLIGFLVKEPIGFQLMLYGSVLHGLWNWKRWTKEGCREWWLIVLPPVLIFGLVSSQTGFNHHMRYVLPAYPFLFIVAARTVTLGKFWKWFSYACLTWQAVAVLWFAPHWMSYFNEAAGGPKNGHKWLVNSNIDWGQDILMLKWWQDKHPEAAPLRAAMFTMFDPKDIGLKFKLPAPFVKGQPEVVTKDGLRGPQPG